MNNFEFIIYPSSSPIAFKFFGYPVRFYGIIMAFSLLVGFYFISKFLNKYFSKDDSDKFLDYIIYLVIFAIFGARLFYVLGAFQFYFNNPSEILLINHGGISIWGAIVFGVLGLIILSKIFKFSFFNHASVFAVFLPLCQAIGRFGNYFNQEAIGSPTNGIIKMFVDKIYRPEEYSDVNYFHPAFLYESVLDLTIFIILFFYIKKNNPRKTVFLYFILYSTVRIIVETIRIDSIFNLSSIPIAIIISFLALIIGLIGFLTAKKDIN